jgi:hypothetical protein
MWFEQEVKPKLKGRAFLVRYADDFVIGFEYESDARKVYEVVPKRFAKYGLQIHSDKTRLRRFGKPKHDNDSETFDFLGFTHYWGKSREGYWVIKRQTARKRLRRTLKAIWAWCKAHRHKNERDQHRVLCRKLQGHYQYFGVTCNFQALNVVYHHTQRAWKHWLSRRSNRSALNWRYWNRFLKWFVLPKPRLAHSTWRQPQQQTLPLRNRMR